MKYIKSSIIALIVIGTVAAAEEPRFGEKDPVALIPVEAAAFVQVRVKRLLDTPAGKQMAAKMPKEMARLEEVPQRFGLKLTDVENFSLVWIKMAADGSSDGPVIVIVTRQPLDRTKVPKNRTIEILAPDLFVGGEDQKHVAAYVDLYKKRSKRGQLEPTTRQVTAQHVVFAGIAGQPNIPWLFPQPFESLKPLGEATSFGLAVMMNDDIFVRMIADYPPGAAAEARDAAGQLPGFAPVFAKNVPSTVPYWRFIVNLVANSRAQVEGQTLRMASNLSPEAIAAILTPPPPPVNPKIDPKEKENIKKIAIAMIDYHDGHEQKFPAHAIYSKDGKPLLSWRVELLPKLGQQELFDKFHRDEPWDSEHNKKLIKEMPELYDIPRTNLPRERGLTFCQIFVGANAPWPKSNESFGMKKVTDGTSQTLMIVQAGQPVIWTKPDDIEYDADKPVPKLGIGGQSVAIALFDASGRELPANWPEKSWRAAITPAGGEKIDWPKSEAPPTSGGKVNEDQKK